jgi:hypothetical protein
MRIRRENIRKNLNENNKVVYNSRNSIPARNSRKTRGLPKTYAVKLKIGRN